LNSTYDGLVTAPDSSSAEDVAKAIASGAKVVKAFNTTFAGTLIAGQVAGQQLDVFIAGDDLDAKNKVAQLVKTVACARSILAHCSVPARCEAMQFCILSCKARWARTGAVL